MVMTWWDDHGTKILGTLASILSGLILIPDLIAPTHLKWWQAANVVLGVLVLRRGFENSRRANDNQETETGVR